jgi:NitT/TauT family transport system substrate-binding protein
MRVTFGLPAFLGLTLSAVVIGSHYFGSARCTPIPNPSSVMDAFCEPAAAAPADSSPITIGYSDWPGWTCWAIAQKEGFFKKHNVNVKLVWFPVYTDSLNAFAANQIDANAQCWSDTMGPLAEGQAAKAVLINDNSAGNDAVVAGPGIHSIKELRGKKVATELGTVEQFLLDKALAANGMTERDVQYINIKVQDCPAAMTSHKVDAVAVWEPNKSQLLADMPGSHVIFDSRSIPGQIPDLLVVQTKVINGRPKDIQGIVDAWYDMETWWRAHPDQAVKIMADTAQDPGTPTQQIAFYKSFIKGTRIFDAIEAKAAFTPSTKPTSLYDSGPSICQFLLGQDQIGKIPNFAAAIDPAFVDAAVAKGEGLKPPYDYTLKVN